MIEKISAVSVQLKMQRRSKEHGHIDLACGTGFFWRHNKDIYLITNWHNVSGRHFETNEPLDKKNSALPNYLETSFYAEGEKQELIPIRSEHSILDEDEKFLPLTHETKKLDIVAMKLNNNLDVKIVCANDFIIPDIKLSVAQDVFVLGYPMGISIEGVPIWKRASIASEPVFNVYQDQPTILIDTATRQGMSGSPVFFYGDFFRTTKVGCRMHMSGQKGHFVGIYSGRLGNDNFEAQLGIVWQKELIDEIIEGNNKCQI